MIERAHSFDQPRKVQFARYHQEEEFLKTVNRFVEAEVLPNTREWEEEQSFPDTLWPKLGELGLLSMTLPKKWGGLDITCLGYCEACRILAKGDPALSMNIAAMNALAAAHIERFGSEEQKEQYLPGIGHGAIKLAWALTEPEAGSDIKGLQMVATPIRDQLGKYLLNGQKMFITNAGKAHLAVVIARVSEKDFSAFLVETNQPGFKDVERIDTVGVRASNTVRFTLDNAVGWHTPCTFEEAISLLFRGRLGIAAMACGIAEKALELSAGYAKQRVQFHRRLADMQSIQNMITDSAVELEAAKLLVEKGARMYDEGKDISLISSMAKLYASETSNRVTNRAIQIHGGRGMMPNYLVEKLWRDSKVTEIGEGCSEIQRLIIAKHILR